ncbi:helix-turn-helix transcriptional regulator [Blastococcus sp. VKM Ac-2987]|uniref:helix-turn-helix transcriptional regulator n=1 Tax=Blastococcus sp. VKM Ac-2987 TaxID=3004141 RepID=UPI0022ABA3A0|nr:YafY family protein [Blastococcus sp. VKM Ac-2987]MCZ2861096.1 YafY family protein [Blastococcus sp. VKM Ac-2987]
MADTGNRTLRLLSLMQGRRQWAGGELADRLGVSLRTLRRDIGRLRELGYPVEAQPGVEGGYRLTPGTALPPLVLDDDEAVALTVGLQAAAQTAVAGMAEASVRALTKVVQVLPPRLRRRADALRAVTDAAAWAGPGGTVDPRDLTVVAQACRDTERLTFAYTAADGTGSDRLVEPHRLVALGRRWYLVAHDLHRGEWRTFRLDRLAAPTATGARFAPRTLPAEDAAAFVRAALGVRGTATRVEVLVHAPAGDVRRRIGQWSTVEPVDDGSCRVRMETDDLAWPAFALGVAGAECEIVSPPELRDVLGEWAARFDRAAAGRPPGPRAPGAGLAGT